MDLCVWTRATFFSVSLANSGGRWPGSTYPWWQRRSPSSAPGWSSSCSYGRGGRSAASRSSARSPRSPSRAGSLEETLDAICDDPRPRDRRLLHDRRDRGRPGRAASPCGSRPGAARGRARASPSAQPSLPRADGRAATTALAGAALLRADVARRDLRDLAHDEEDLEFLRGLGMRSAITVALQARGQADRRADPRRRLVGAALPPRGRPLRRGPLRPGRADARQRRPLLRPRARRASAGGDRRDAAARPAAAAAAPHPRLVGRGVVPAGRGRERGRRRLLRRLPASPAAGCW